MLKKWQYIFVTCDSFFHERVNKRKTEQKISDKIVLSKCLSKQLLFVIYSIVQMTANKTIN